VEGSTFVQMLMTNFQVLATVELSSLKHNRKEIGRVDIFKSLLIETEFHEEYFKTINVTVYDDKNILCRIVFFFWFNKFLIGNVEVINDKHFCFNHFYRFTNITKNIDAIIMRSWYHIHFLLLFFG